MKIKAMKRSASTDKETAFRTEPPISEKVLDYAINNLLGKSYASMYSVKNELLIVSKVAVPHEELELLAERLTEAETHFKRTKERVETAREKDLDGRAKTAGVTLED